MTTNYVGLWRRESIQLGDADPFEDSTVLWIQAQHYFADIRIPLNQPSLPSGQSLQDLSAPDLLKFATIKGFAGKIDFTDSWIRWNRLIDFRPDPGRIDQGQVHYEGKNLIEIGEFLFEKQSKYLEVWVPQISDPTSVLALELVREVNHTTGVITHPKALLVAVNEHFIRIVDNRDYPPDYSAPDPATLSDAELKRLMQFEIDYGHKHGALDPGKILFSSDPNRVGLTMKAKPDHETHWQQETLWIETWKTSQGEHLEHQWQVRETIGDQHW